MTYGVLIYAGLIVIIGGFGAAAIYHAFKFGYKGDQTRLGVGIYLAVFGLLLIASFLLLVTSPGSEVS